MGREDRDAVVKLQENLENTLRFEQDRLYGRSEWGSTLNLEEFRADFERAFGLAKIFQDLPYHLLPDQPLGTINGALSKTIQHLQQVDNFSIDTANNPKDTLQNLGSQMADHADSLTTAMAQWISYLAYQKGDVSQNINQLTGALSESKQLLKDTKAQLEKDKAKVEGIVQQAQDIAGDKGVAIFTQQFDKAASDAKDEANNWLRATAVIFAVTIVVLAVFMFQLVGVNDWWQWAPRAALVGIFVTAGFWCGKTYRILRHQQTTNAHKANGLKTFLAFRDASDNDPVTRNAVLLETTRSIFHDPSTGFISEESRNTPGDIRLMEPVRLANTAAKGTNSSE